MDYCNHFLLAFTDSIYLLVTCCFCICLYVCVFYIYFIYISLFVLKFQLYRTQCQIVVVFGIAHAQINAKNVQSSSSALCTKFYNSEHFFTIKKTRWMALGHVKISIFTVMFIVIEFRSEQKSYKLIFLIFSHRLRLRPLNIFLISK